ncbi:MAG TPA: UvrD-helicase domain-containing protein [Patescibacteria group bacterium]
MDKKEAILLGAKSHLKKVLLNLEKGRGETEKSLKRSKEIFKTLSDADKIVESRLMRYNKKRIGEISYLKGSPYFVRCDVVWENEKEVKSIYFGKFGFSEDEIYSWITPASTIRYENPGDVKYVRPDGLMQKAKLVRKDQYMIVGGEIKFLSSEAINKPRELIYQEYFSNRKTGFVLPEIVAQMEKAQDQVIRAHHVGPFLISGPAGSGKTTLALHRVAYLVQAPDLSDKYTSDSIVVFVQDNGTKEYFSHLLPELGIDDVLITTFSEWAFSILDIDAHYVIRPGESETEKDLYEFAKLKALRNPIRETYRKNNIFSILENMYDQHFDLGQKKIFQEQKRKKTLDGIDLALLLKIYSQSNGGIGTVKDYWEELKNGNMRKKRGFVPFEYSLAVVDEFQNYLPEQLELIKSCINKKSQSILYVGDMAQQVQLGTIRNWDDIGERINEERKVVLQKVYRNTKSILRYIKSLGYDIEIPEGIKEGSEVGEYICADEHAEIKHINTFINGREFSSAGILAKDQEYLEEFKKAFSSNEKIHIMTMNEAQGVEFDIVFLVGISKDAFSVLADGDVSNDLLEEKGRINRDLLYVALTRAISELHVLGREKLGHVA